MHFSENPIALLQAYVDNGEGLDRAGGFAAQVKSCRSIVVIASGC